MNKLALSFLMILFCGIASAQTTRERVLYIVDKIPIIETHKDDEDLLKEDVDNLEVITDSTRIKTLGYGGKIDKIIMITTKAYLKRTPEEKLIPSTKSMVRKDGQWFMTDANAPYTGPFIDYFTNGKKQGDGTLKEGVVDGVRTVYYPNGNKRYFYTYTKGVQNGASEEYFINGKLRQKGSFINEKQTGLWQIFYSTGKLKRQSTFVNNKDAPTKEETTFYALLEKAIGQMKEDEYSSAIKKLNDAEKLNPNYADLYFYRGTAKLNSFDFDNAIIDFEKAVEIEPLYIEATTNRAFARMRKYEFKGSRTISKTNGVTILAGSKDKVSIPKEDLDKICADLNLGYSLGDHNQMTIDAISKYCK